MQYLSYIEPVFKMWELILTVDSPPFVKNVNMYLDFKDVIKNKEDTILMGTVYYIINMVDKQITLEWGGVVESYTDEESKEKAQKAILFQLKYFLEEDLKEEKYKNFWDSIDFEKEDWKRKEGL